MPGDNWFQKFDVAAWKGKRLHIAIEDQRQLFLLTPNSINSSIINIIEIINYINYFNGRWDVPSAEIEGKHCPPFFQIRKTEYSVTFHKITRLCLKSENFQLFLL